MKGLADYQRRRDDGLGYSARQLLVIDGHQVAWVHYSSPDGSFSGHEVMCDCDLRVLAASQRPERCVYKDVALHLRALQYARDHGRLRLSLLGFDRELLSDALVELLSDACAGEWVGQRADGGVSMQTAALALGLAPLTVIELADELRADKRLWYSGDRLVPYSSSYEPYDDDDSHLDDAQPPQGQPLTGRTLFHSETGTEGGYWAFQDDHHVHYDNDLHEGQCPWGADSCPVVAGYSHEHYSYEGLHTLRTGDYLQVLADDDQLLWQGYLRLRHFALFSETAAGMWIHAEQRGVEREQWARWFIEPHRALLWRAER